jgi:CRP-like cAMP-binding protein
LKNFPIFQSVEEHNVEEFSSLLKLEQYVKGDTIIKKGDPGRNLYIISTGQVEVLGDGDMSIAFLTKGEVFGEMSLLSGNPVGATVKAVEPSSVLYISSKDFRRILDKSPSLQMYFTRLLARRMAEINLARSEEFSSGMTGKLSEMPPSELFQTFNMNQKTGILSLTQSQKSASLTFREGELIDARYGEYEGEEAFFELLKLKEGRFKFKPGLPPEMLEAPEIGDFMAILMEGLRRIDEADRKFLKTLIPNLSMDDIPTAETENSK